MGKLDLKDRVSAIIIKDKKILLVTGYDESYYWTPGGKVEDNETYEFALKRELKEELKINVTNISPYFNYISLNKENKKQKVFCYIVGINGNISVGKEITKFAWFSKKEIKNMSLHFAVLNNLIPKLIGDKLI